MDQPTEKVSELISKAIRSKDESKRTTFKLGIDSLEALEWLCNNLDVSAKKVLDLVTTEGEILNVAIQAAQERKINAPKDPVRKTFVISSKALGQLNKASSKNNVARDSLLEVLLLAYRKFVEKFQDEERKREEKALEIISEFMAEAEKKYGKRLREVLDNEHPILKRFGVITIIIENLLNAIQEKLEEGTPIDPEDF